MIVLDIVCLVITIILVLQGLWYGFLKGLFFLIAWVAAAAGAYFCYDIFGNFIASIFNISNTTNHIACIAIGFLVPFVLLNIAGRLLHGAISKTMFSIPNRILGILLGLIKACICCSMILTIVHILPLTGSWEQGRNESIAYSLYLKELTFFGFDTKQPDLTDFVTGKASNAKNATADSTKVNASNAKNAESTNSKKQNAK